MASGAVGGELRLHVVRVSGRIVIRRVATRTSVGRSVVIPVVAGSAIAGNGGVCPVQRVVIIVD